MLFSNLFLEVRRTNLTAITQNWLTGVFTCCNKWVYDYVYYLTRLSLSLIKSGLICYFYVFFHSDTIDSGSGASDLTPYSSEERLTTAKALILFLAPLRMQSDFKVPCLNHQTKWVTSPVPTLPLPFSNAYTNPEVFFNYVSYEWGCCCVNVCVELLAIRMFISIQCPFYSGILSWMSVDLI